ncbi:hypothetical protein IPZ61_15795 [Streptomyces sioyaensis]|uniref:hypothetical protein n=1 Tax=Streptomyces sioyaensis TaxID=67364 RepID=UPI001F416E12|nr:hypothetical protein [Streptomyces sioyaensis]MCF3174781.1 hypothetical protein [Streptomyces sioyaensis]
MNTKTTETGGKHYATVSAGDRVVYRTPGYYTAGMALADAQCWEAFHGGKNMTTYTLAVTPMVEGGKMDLPGEYATKADAWLAVQRTFFNEAVTVLEDGKGVGTFQWFRAGEEPSQNEPGKVVSVRNLCKWTRKGWVRTGVQAVGNGKELGRYRFIRTVAL